MARGTEIWQWRIVCRLTGTDHLVDQPAGDPEPTECPVNSAHGVTSVQLWSRRHARVDYSGTLAPPGGTRDVADGWDPGSRILATDGQVYECTDNTAGTAVWSSSGRDQDRHYDSEEALDSTTITFPLFQTRVTLGPFDYPAGTYEVGHYCEWQFSSSSRDWHGRVVQSGVSTALAEINSAPRGTASFYSWKSSVEVVLAGGSETFNLEYGRSSSPGTALIRRARLWIRRVG